MKAISRKRIWVYQRLPLLEFRLFMWSSLARPISHFDSVDPILHPPPEADAFPDSRVILVDKNHFAAVSGTVDRGRRQASPIADDQKLAVRIPRQLSQGGFYHAAIGAPRFAQCVASLEPGKPPTWAEPPVSHQKTELSQEFRQGESEAGFRFCNDLLSCGRPGWRSTTVLEGPSHRSAPHGIKSELANLIDEWIGHSILVLRSFTTRA